MLTDRLQHLILNNVLVNVETLSLMNALEVFFHPQLTLNKSYNKYI